MTGSGDKFGKVDSNTANGMTVESCCDNIIKGIYLQYTELMVGDLTVQILPYIAQITWLTNIISDIKYKSQLKSKEKAK